MDTETESERASPPREIKLVMRPIGVCGAITGMELVRIEKPKCSDLARERLKSGIEKEIMVLFKPFGADTLTFYDQHSRVIADMGMLSSDATKKVICTNQVVSFQQELVGTVIFSQKCTLVVNKDVSNKLRVVFEEGEHVFHDQFSMLSWRPAVPLGRLRFVCLE